MRKYLHVLIGLTLLLILGCMCMMPMGMMHKGHERKSPTDVGAQHAEPLPLCQCDCVEKEGECHCRHAS